MNEQECRNQIQNLSFMLQFPQGIREILVTVLLEVSDPVQLAPDTVIFREGEQGNDSGCILLSGEVSIQKSGDPPFPCPAPELLGEMKQFNPNAKRTATVTVAGQAEALRFNWSDFQTALKRYVSDSDHEVVQKGLENYAWQHFTM